MSKIFATALSRMREARLVRILGALAVGYVLAPVDAIPDVLPGVGQIDDLTVVLIAAGIMVIAFAAILFMLIAEQWRLMLATSLCCLTTSLGLGTARAWAVDEIIQSPISDNTQALEPAPSDLPNKPVNRFALSLTKAFATAQEQNPEIRAAQKNIDAAKAQIKIAGARPNPQFALQYGFGTPYTEIVAGNTQTAGANQLIEMGGKRAARLKYARANFTLTQDQLAALHFDVRCRVRRAYAELAAAEANVELVESQRKLIARLYHIAHRRFEAGAAPEVESMQAQLALDQFDTLRNSALGRLRQASAQLDYLVGMQPDKDIDVEDNALFRLSSTRNELVPQPDFVVPPIADLLAAAYRQRPDLAAAKQQNIVNRRSLSLARTQQIPDVLLGSGYVFSTFKSNQHVSPQKGAYLNVNVDVPIFYHHEGEVAQAKASLAQSNLQLATLNAQIATDVHTSYAAFTAARANVKRYQNTLMPRAQEVVRLAQRSYEVGRTELASAIVAEQSFQQTMSGYFDAVVSYQTAWADLEKAIGAPVKF